MMHRFLCEPAGNLVQISKEPVCKERCDGGHQPAHCFEAFIECLICTDLIMFVFAFPETAAAEANIPVAEVGITKSSMVLPAWVGSYYPNEAGTFFTRLFSEEMIQRSISGLFFPGDIAFFEGEAIHVSIQCKTGRCLYSVPKNLR